MLNKQTVLAQIDSEAIKWLKTTRGNDPAFYRHVRACVASEGLLFSLSYALNPFKAEDIDLTWDQAWSKALIQEWKMHSWLGANIEWSDGNESRPGTTVVRIYDGRVGAELLRLSESFSGWQRPMPEDLAIYDRKGNVLCFSVAHEQLLFCRPGFLSWVQ
jgi:hypothetical protein